MKTYRKVPIDSFNHIDVLYGKDANEQLYGSVVENVMVSSSNQTPVHGKKERKCVSANENKLFRV